MKTKFLKAWVLENRQRDSVALLLFVCLLSLSGTPGSAQLLHQKLITALHLGEAAEGSRVTIVSDSGLSDYEAFRRGDRFYVKIPLAEFKSVVPRCCASGFEDVQVQRVGDSLVISFRLQPGATARVDQRSNRIDVIFSSPTRTFRNTANSGSNRGATGTNVSRNSQVRGPDAAGPMPPGSAQGLRQRVVTERARAATDNRALQNAQPSRRTDPNKGPNKQSIGGTNQTAKGNTQLPTGDNQSSTAGSQSTTSNPAIGLPSPAPSSSPILTPSTPASYPALTTATRTASVSSEPTIGSSTSSGSPSFLNWKARGQAAFQWVSANPLATLLGALILLSLILYLGTALRRRQKKLIAAKRANASKVQPKISSDADLDELGSGDSVTSPASSKLSLLEVAKQPGTAPASATPQNHSWLTKPSAASATAGRERGKDEEEREVFEL
jgi:hypothetical protein